MSRRSHTPLAIAATWIGRCDGFWCNAKIRPPIEGRSSLAATLGRDGPAGRRLAVRRPSLSGAVDLSSAEESLVVPEGSLPRGATGDGGGGPPPAEACSSPGSGGGPAGGAPGDAVDGVPAASFCATVAAASRLAVS